jgi:hypothetical protein
MSGLFRRIRRTRAAAAEESRLDQPAPSEPHDATTTAQFPGGEQPLAGMRDLPAGLEPEELRSPRPATERRARLRRRMRYLRRVRELLLRDLGGLVYEIHRAASGDRAHQETLVQAKAERIAALDGELYALEERLGSGHPETVLREPGVGGACPACGELHASDARFCSACGRPLTGRAAAMATASERRAAEGEAEPPGDEANAPEPATPATEPVVERGAAPVETPLASEAPTTEQPDAEDRDARFTSNGRSAGSVDDLATPVERPS